VLRQPKLQLIDDVAMSLSSASIAENPK